MYLVPNDQLYCISVVWHEWAILRYKLSRTLRIHIMCSAGRTLRIHIMCSAGRTSSDWGLQEILHFKRIFKYLQFKIQEYPWRLQRRPYRIYLVYFLTFLVSSNCSELVLFYLCSPGESLNTLNAYDQKHHLAFRSLF